MNIARLFRRNRPSRRQSRRFTAASSRNMPHSQIQTLEQRTLLAGDVTAQLIGRDAFIRGDDADNSVEIVVQGGNVVVRGLDGTTINGGTTPFVLATGSPSLRDDLNVSLGGGNDRFVIADGVIIPDDLTVWAGSGNDQIALSDSTVGDDVTIHGQSGEDTISIQTSMIGDDLKIHGSSGKNLINISRSAIGDDLKVHGGSADDDIVLLNTTIGDDSRIYGHGGNDDIVIRNSTISDDARVDAGSGNDVVMTEDSNVGDDARIYGRSGDDIIISTDSGVGDKFRADGGSGTDSLQVDTASTAGRTRFRRIESDTADAAVVAARITHATTGALARAAAAAASFDPGLVLTVNNATVAENGGTGVATVTITRNTSLNSALTVNLSSSIASRLTPASATVTIPAGQASTTVALNAINNTAFDGNARVTITATAAGLDSGSVDVSVTDDEVATLSVSISGSSIVEDTGSGGTAGSANTRTVTVTRSGSTSSALTVNLASSAPTRLTVPATVTIPAGQTQATVTATTVPNLTVDGNANVTVTATATGFVTGTDNITVTDNDQTQSLSVTAGTTSVSEAAGAGATTITITRNVVSASPLTVNLASSNSNRLTVPATATIAANQASVTVNVSTVNNNVVDGNASVVITATATQTTPGQTTVAVTDDDVASITLTPTTASVQENAGTLTLNVARSGSTATQETINLQYSTGKISGPATVTLGAGVQDVDITLNVADDAEFDSNTVSTIRASAAGRPTVSTAITVVNDDVLTLTLDSSPNTVVQSLGTLITKDQSYTVAGTTAPGATVSVDRDGNGSFDDGTTTAAPDGTFSVDVTLLHTAANDGANTLQVRSRLSNGSEVFRAVDVHYALGTVVRFETNQDLNQDSVGDFYDVELLNTDAPNTVANFRNYIDTGRYQNMFAHRSPPDFVVQAGGFTIQNGQVSSVPTFGTIQGEFNQANPNVRGTLSMALTSAGPNSGTSQWFVNVVDNPHLNNAQHTVFGRVIGDGMETVDLINGLFTFNLTDVTGVSALGEVPITTPPLSALTGTVSATNGSNIVTGNGTLFSSELQTGSIVSIAGAQFRVTGIQSNTRLTVDRAIQGTISGVIPAVVTLPPDEDFIIFSDIGELLDTI